MARPRSEVREAVTSVLTEVGVAGITVREVYQRLVSPEMPITLLQVRCTIKNMVRQGGEAESVGRVKAAGSQHWEHLIALKEQPAPEPGAALVGVMHGFAACAAEA